MDARHNSRDLAGSLETLERHHVEYVVVGGFGSQIHGTHRQTYDLDLVPRSTAENAERLAGALRELNARPRVAGMTDEEARQLPVVVDAATVQALGSTTLTTDAGPLGVLQTLPVAGGNREYDKLDERAVEVVLSGTRFRVGAPGHQT